WMGLAVPGERIVLCPRSENFWQAGPSGPCGPCSELYVDRGLDQGSAEDLPGGENDRFLEYWNLVFMQYELAPLPGGAGDRVSAIVAPLLKPLAAKNVDTGLGLNGMAVIVEGEHSVSDAV